MGGALAALGLTAFVFTVYVLAVFGPRVMRIFEEPPMFLAPPSQPIADAESVELSTRSGRRLAGSYFPALNGPRRGVILFCHEFTANRWLVEPYLGFLRDQGFDLFSIDFCNHGDSDPAPGYRPLQWVTAHEIEDVESAIAYLKTRRDTPADGIGVFGVSKGGGAALVAAARDSFVRCVATDGAFPTHDTVTHYEMKWVDIYSSHPQLYRALPRRFYHMIGEMVIWWASIRRRVHYVRVEAGMRALRGRPLLMIHGMHDNYIHRDIVARFAEMHKGPRELWLVKGAKHNGCLAKAGAEYRRRVGEFFRRHLDPDPSAVHQERSTVDPGLRPTTQRERGAAGALPATIAG